MALLRERIASGIFAAAMPIGDQLTGPLDLASLARDYADGTRKPSDVIAAVSTLVTARGADGTWISLTQPDALKQAAQQVQARRAAGERLPLYGVPFAVKDNIDVAGLPTTAACPAFSYTPQVSAPAVARLVAAGAVVIGKTNMDQFATGLVGVRSPYGVPRNPFNPDFIVGGSSSGSAVAVATGAVSFALGTDTAGSGRLPAGYNNIVGLKPSRGVISATGVVPACRSLDCVSVFAATVEDAAVVAELMRGFDPRDPFSRPEANSARFAPVAVPGTFRFGVPALGNRDFLGDSRAAAAFESAVEACVHLGGTPTLVDMAPFYEAGTLLYGGAFVSERLEAAGALLTTRPEELLPVLRAILEDARRHDASAAFAAQAQLRLLRRRVAPIWTAVDFLLLPTAPTIPRIDAVAREPLRLNAALGVYATFVNLLDLAALAVPAGFRNDHLPAGVTLMGPWGGDARLAGFGSRLHRTCSQHIGATNWPLPSTKEPIAARDSDDAPDLIPIAVVGAHLTGEPLNHELTSAGGRFLRACKTQPQYHLFALRGTTPAKPGMLRTTNGDGVAVEVELWGLPPAAFGAFVQRIPAPLGVGKIELDDGTSVSGLLCEAHATIGAQDISVFGGWRAYRRSVA